MWSKYNIDALKNDDGSFRHASYAIIKGAAKCGHTAHLETEHGVVAFRPFKVKTKGPKRFLPANTVGDHLENRWRLDFYGPYQDDIANRDSENAEFGYGEGIDLIRWAFEHLNGSMDTWYEPGDGIDVWANQAEREGYVLATIGDKVMLEYEMPGTTAKYAHHPAQPTSALRVITTIGLEEVGGYTAYSYNNVPKPWLRAIKAAGMTDWIGMGQRSIERIPFPTEAI